MHAQVTDALLDCLVVLFQPQGIIFLLQKLSFSVKNFLGIVFNVLFLGHNHGFKPLVLIDLLLVVFVRLSHLLLHALNLGLSISDLWQKFFFSFFLFLGIVGLLLNFFVFVL